MDTIVLYHGGCQDGFCAAWVVNKYFEALDNNTAFGHQKNIEYHPAYYGQDPPDVTGKDVIIVDFCYSVEVMESILTKCSSLIWIDHHKTAVPVFDVFSQFFGGATPLKVKFAIEKSGAGLAWDYFFPNKPRPWLVDYVEDRDLWVKRLHESDRVNAYIACNQFDFNIWDIMSNMSLGDAIYHGKTAEMKTEQYVREVCKNVYFADLIPPEYDELDAVPLREIWRNIPIVNICQVDCSEVCDELCKRYPESPFSLYWFKRADGMYQYGLRSIGDFDVSTVAKLFGGGGHKNAAGFQLDYLLEELK